MARRKRKPAKVPAFARKLPPKGARREGPTIEMPSARPERKKRTRADVDRGLADDYRAVFNSPQGERVKADLMLSGNVYHEIQGDSLFALGIKEGERRVALRIAKYLGLRPEHFPVEAWATAEIANNMMGA